MERVMCALGGGKFLVLRRVSHGAVFQQSANHRVKCLSRLNLITEEQETAPQALLIRPISDDASYKDVTQSILAFSENITLQTHVATTHLNNSSACINFWTGVRRLPTFCAVSNGSSGALFA
jgi:hypothetical protein